MGKMVRKQVYITIEQEELLKRRAAATGSTESELLRQSIDHTNASPALLPFDEQAWQDELAFLRERATLPSPGGKRSWMREELHDRSH